MNRRLLVPAALALTALAAIADAYEIGEALLEEAFWKSDPVLFVKRHSEQGFNFTSESRDGADSRLDGGVTYFGVPVYESRINFADDASGIERVELTLYSMAGTESIDSVSDRRVRNDKTITRDEFIKILNDVRGRLTPSGSKNPVPTRSRTKGRLQSSQVWPKTSLPTETTLTWNFFQEGSKADTFKPGFIRVAVDGPTRLAGGKPKVKGRSAKTEAKGRKSIADNVTPGLRGDVFVDNIPMVDQGQKGYCAVAAAERVLRYYGVEVDEHEIAQAAGTKAAGGTSAKGMKESVNLIGKRFRLATMTLYGDHDKEPGERIAGLTEEVANYNKAAKKLKKKEIAKSVYIRHEGNTTYFDPSAVDEAMDAEVLREMKVNGSQKSKYKKFMSDIHQYINAGMPLFWGVKFGTYPEPDTKQELGYHIRLIIGYNDKKREILYSDTWGAGHELKRMPADWAWTISQSLMVMKPLSR